MIDTAASSRLPGELRVLAVRLEALGMNARPLWDAAKLAATHAKEAAVGETDVSPTRRYELSVLVGPCSEKEADDLVYELAEVSKRLGGAVSWNPYNEEAEAAVVAEQDAGLSAEREAEIRLVVERRSWLNAENARELLAALDAEREWRRRAEQQAETLAEALEWIAANYAEPAAQAIADDALAGYRAGRDEAKL